MTSPPTPSTPHTPRSRRRIAGERRPLRPEGPARAGGAVETEPPAEVDGDTAHEWPDSQEATVAAPATIAEPPATVTEPPGTVAERPAAARTGPSWAVVTALAVLAVLLATTAAVLGV